MSTDGDEALRKAPLNRAMPTPVAQLSPQSLPAHRSAAFGQELVNNPTKRFSKQMSIQGVLASTSIREDTEHRLRHFAKRGMLHPDSPTGAQKPMGMYEVRRRSSSFMSVVMEYEWYNRGFFIEHFIEERFYYCFLAWILFVILVGSLVMFFNEEELLYFDAVYAAAACVTQSGLSSTDWSTRSNTTHVASLVLMWCGSMPLMIQVPVLLRRASYRRHDQAYKEALQDPRVSGAGLSGVEEEGFAADFNVARKLSKQHLEYRALGKVVKIIFCYWLVVHVVGCSLFFLFSHTDQMVVQSLARFKVPKAWHALYITASAFQNNGLALTPDSVVHYNQSAFHLTLICALILMGNTGFPICLRVIMWCRWRCCTKGSKNCDAYSFVLEHPRRLCTHLFPAVHTAWLLLVLLTLLVLNTVVFCMQEWHKPVTKDMNGQTKVLNAFFQAVSSRTAGLNSVPIDELSAATTFLLLVAMYISTSPTTVVMRFSGHQNGEMDAEELDICGVCEGREAVGEDDAPSVRDQAKRYFLQDVVYLIVIAFFVLYFEGHQLDQQLSHSCKSSAINSGGLGAYGDFSVYKVFFEIVSAYGTVGLSLGYRGSPASFSGSWTRPSQVLIIIAMVLGRMRGLPDSIDPSFAFTMKVTEGQEHNILAKEDHRTRASKSSHGLVSVTDEDSDLFTPMLSDADSHKQPRVAC